MTKKITFKLFSCVELVALVCVVLLYTVFYNTSKNNYFFTIIDNSKINSIIGYVQSNPVKTSSGKFYIFDVKTTYTQTKKISSSSQGVVKIMCPTSIVESHYPGKLYNKYGSIIEVGGKINFFNLNYLQNDSFYSGIYLCNNIELLGWKNNFCKFRAFCRLQFKRLMFQWKDCGGLLLALLSGSKEYTNVSLANAFKNAGLSHILALSGMHLSFFSAIAIGISKKLTGKKYQNFFSLLAIIIFVWFAGLSPSLLRALLCSIISIIFSALFVNTSFLCVLVLSFLIQSIISPLDVYSLAFMLSYGALFGIIFFSDFFYRILSFFLPKYLSSNFASSLGAQIITLPICLVFFKTFAPIGIIATVVVSPLISVFLILGFLFTIISLCIPPLLLPLGVLLNFVYNIIDVVVCFFEKFPTISI